MLSYNSAIQKTSLRNWFISCQLQCNVVEISILTFTLTANNSGLKASKLKNYHIFRIHQTSLRKTGQVELCKIFSPNQLVHRYSNFQTSASSNIAIHTFFLGNVILPKICPERDRHQIFLYICCTFGQIYAPISSNFFCAKYGS